MGFALGHKALEVDIFPRHPLHQVINGVAGGIDQNAAILGLVAASCEKHRGRKNGSCDLNSFHFLFLHILFAENKTVCYHIRP